MIGHVLSIGAVPSSEYLYHCRTRVFCRWVYPLQPTDQPTSQQRTAVPNAPKNIEGVPKRPYLVPGMQHVRYRTRT